jgi:hypothetical protein
MTPVILYVAPAGLGYWWPYIDPLLVSALKHSNGEMNLDDVKLNLLSGDMHLLVGVTDDIHDPAMCICVSTVVVYPQYKALRTVLAAGPGFHEWIGPVIEKLEQGCATIGADTLEMFGRPGFIKALKEYAEPKYTVMVRRVNHVRRRRDEVDTDVQQDPVGTRGGRPHQRCDTGVPGVGADPP